MTNRGNNKLFEKNHKIIYASYDDECKYYLYRHIRLDKNEPFYIGIGTKKKSNTDSKYIRATEKRAKNKIWEGIYNKNNKNIKIEIIYECNDKKEIHQKEIEFIKLYGRIDLGTGILSNLTEGGYGLFQNTIERNKVQKKTAVTIYNYKGEFYKHFESCTDAARDLGSSTTCGIHYALNGKSRTFKGYIVKSRANNEENIEVNFDWRTQRLFCELKVIDINGNSSLYKNVQDFCDKIGIERRYFFHHLRGWSNFPVLKNLKFQFCDK